MSETINKEEKIAAEKTVKITKDESDKAEKSTVKKPVAKKKTTDDGTAPKTTKPSAKKIASDKTVQKPETTAKPVKTVTSEKTETTVKPVKLVTSENAEKSVAKKIKASEKPAVTKYETELAKSRVFVDAIAKTLTDKKAYNVVAIKVDHLTTLADYFLIAGAKSTTAVRALANAVDEMTSKEMGIEARHKEGLREGRWAAMDFGSVILHIFLEEAREFYQLERLWVDGLNTINYN